MFVVTSEGVIVVEPVNTDHAQALLKAIRSVTDKHIRYLLHSHNHWDHSGGGQVFRDVGATIVSHVEGYEWMKANPHPDMALPNESWAGNRKDIVLGGRTMELHCMAVNHGLGMTVFRFPKEKIVYIADLVTPNRVLFAMAPDFNMKEFVRTLKEIEKIDFDKTIYSHSQTKEPFGSKAEVRQTLQFIEYLENAIFSEFKKGTSFDEVPIAVKLPQYKDWAMYDARLPLNVWKIMLEKYMGSFPWRPVHPYERSD